ncbi:ABC transporter permease [Massilia sp. TS11]|uniref:ABC transporter permease n=1 Tax=Massilia sp. TS11 TaxID=2908003 RepID=UPI001EDAB145|nr:FtsX-like permease family protein [Massilia sp. TS11]MCG2585700.1 FtsX-like permease family protein [Massilia sp. TS11]
MLAKFPWLAMALKNAMRNRRRSFATLAITAIGTAAALLGGGFALQTYESLAEFSARDTGHVVVAAPHHFDNNEASPLEHGLAGSEDLRRKLLAMPGVMRVLPRLQFSGLISNGDKSEIVIGSGVDASQEYLVKGPTMRTERGVLLDAHDPARGPGIVIGKGLAQNLHAEPGSSLTLISTTTTGSLNALDVVVTGVVSTGVTEVDRRLAMVDLSTAQALLATKKVSSLSVYLEAMDQTDAFAAKLKAEQGGQLEVRTWLEQAQFYQSVKNIYDRIFGFIGVIVLVIVLFAVTNTLAMAVLERTREIGTLRAMGATPGEVMKVFTLEGVSLAGGGAVLGMLVAAVVALCLVLFKVQMPPPPGRSQGYPLVVTVSPLMYLGAAVTVTLLSALAAWFVSRKAAKQAVVEALSHV